MRVPRKKRIKIPTITYLTYEKVTIFCQKKTIVFLTEIWGA